MSGLAFTGDMAQLQQAVAESQDIVVRRGIVLAALNLRTGERVLELGCGGGYLAREVALDTRGGRSRGRRQNRPGRRK